MRQSGLIVVSAAAFCAGAMASDYSPGFVWDRSLDWTPGKVEGYSWQNGNPDDDKKDNPVWACEFAKGGGGLGDPNPWYKQPKTLMVWDASWYGGGEGVWAQGNNQHPPIYKTLLIHVVQGQGDFENTPLVRWINPAGADATVHITGNLKVYWAGQANLDVPLTCDVAVVSVSPTGVYTVLFGASYDDPSPGDQNVGVKTVQIDLPGVVIPEGGSILIGVHGQTVQANRWFNMEDNLKITLDALEGGGGCTADIDGNGVLDLFDFLGFVNLFNAGC